MIKRNFIFFCLLIFSFAANASYILIPMDHKSEKNHLKAYGLTYWVINGGSEAYWPLNYKGGSFAYQYRLGIENECKVRGISYEVIADGQWAQIRPEIANQEVNQEAI